MHSSIIVDDYSNQSNNHSILSIYILSLYSGLVRITGLAIFYYMKDTLSVNPYTLSLLLTIISIPWIIKPLFGVITDTFPIFGYRRKIYIIICSILSSLIWIILYLFDINLIFLGIYLFLLESCCCFISVLGDASLVDHCKSENKIDSDDNKTKDNVSIFFIWKNIGNLISSFLKGYLLEIMSPKKVFLIGSGIQFISLFAGIILDDKNINENTIKEVINNDYKNISNENESKINIFFSFILQKEIYIPTLFIILIISSPSYSNALFYFVTEVIKFTPLNLGIISLFASLTAILSILIYKKYLKNVSLKNIFLYGTVISFFFSFLAFLFVERINIKLGISDLYFAIFSVSINSFVGEFLFMPILSYAAILCPNDLEGTIYSLFMSCLNLGSMFSELFGAGLIWLLGITKQNYDYIGTLVLICNFCTLLPLPLLFILDNKYFEEQKINENNKEKEICLIKDD